MKISWDEYAINMLDNIASRSQDPDTKVGCVILDTDNRIIGTGYNSPPSGIKLEPQDLVRPQKYQYIVHAELNAILFAETAKLKGATLYVPFLPCNDCAKVICQVGISRVVYQTEYISKAANANPDATRKLFSLKEILLEKYTK